MGISTFERRTFQELFNHDKARACISMCFYKARKLLGAVMRMQSWIGPKNKIRKPVRKSLTLVSPVLSFPSCGGLSSLGLCGCLGFTPRTSAERLAQVVGVKSRQVRECVEHSVHLLQESEVQRCISWNFNRIILRPLRCIPLPPSEKSCSPTLKGRHFSPKFRSVPCCFRVRLPAFSHEQTKNVEAQSLPQRRQSKSDPSRALSVLGCCRPWYSC